MTKAAMGAEGVFGASGRKCAAVQLAPLAQEGGLFMRANSQKGGAPAYDQQGASQAAGVRRRQPSP